MHTVLYWVTAVRVMNSIASLVTVPIVSALLAQAAVVHTQRHRAGQSFSVRQAFALADKGWPDVPILWESNFVENGRGLRSQFLWLAAGMIFLSKFAQRPPDMPIPGWVKGLIIVTGAIQQPIQQVMVTIESRQVITCNDIPVHMDSNRTSRNGSIFHTGVNYDPEAADLASIPQDNIIKRVSANIISVSAQDAQPHLWPEKPVGAAGHDATRNTGTFPGTTVPMTMYVPILHYS